MSRITRRRLSRLEKRVASEVAERKRREPELMARRRQDALYHATKLVTLILHGDAQIDEPLAIAWERALGHLGLSGTPQELLYYRLRAALADLPGDTEIAKFAHIFRSAPSWLLDFCNGFEIVPYLALSCRRAQSRHRHMAGTGFATLTMRGRIYPRVRLAQVVLFPNSIPGSRLVMKKAWI